MKGKDAPEPKEEIYKKRVEPSGFARYSDKSVQKADNKFLAVTLEKNKVAPRFKSVLSSKHML